MNKEVFEIGNYYDLVLRKNENYDSYVLVQISQPQLTTEMINELVIEKVQGFTKKSLEKIIEKYGEEWYKVAEKHNYFEKDLVIKTPSRKKSLKEFLSTFENETYKFFLRQHLIIYYENLKEFFKKSDFLLELTQLNVYKFYFELGWHFYDVHRFALALYKPDENIIQRTWMTKSLILKYFEEQYTSNSTFFKYEPYKIFQKIKREWPGARVEYVTDILDVMLETKELIYFDALDRICTAEMYKKNLYILQKVFLLKSNKTLPLIYNKKSSIKWSEKQQKAYLEALQSGFYIISGFPGTGKSYLIEHIYKSFIESNVYKKDSVAILAPTGKATANIRTKTKVTAQTIHSYFKIDHEFAKNFDSIPESDKTRVLIIDEFSMVNVDLFYTILLKCPNLERLILVGDSNQLPCIGPGNLLEEFMEAKDIDKIYLTEIFRTEFKDISDNFVAVQGKNYPIMQSEHIFFHETNLATFYENFPLMYEKLREIYEIDDIAILIPTNEIINQTNKIIQQYRLEKHETQDIGIAKIHKNEKLYIGDKIICVINKPSENIVNGETGEFIGIDGGNYVFSINNGEKILKLNQKTTTETIKLAYATTVHKFQGSESKVVVFCAFAEVEYMLTNRLIYTAVSRAQEKLIILGSEHHYLSGIRNSDEHIETIMSYLLNTRQEKWN
ncbi:ATP-dependent DNA helicase [Mycoplasmopsis columbinasalis]|nr:AAA family ATPase [Mycoplasmopsis columbinasalis]